MRKSENCRDAISRTGEPQALPDSWDGPVIPPSYGRLRVGGVTEWFDVLGRSRGDYTSTIHHWRKRCRYQWALRARELNPEWGVTVAVADRYPNFSICGIPYFLSQEVPDADNLAHRKAADIQAMGVELLLDHRVEQIDPAAHRVITRSTSGETSEHGYDKLVVGTGAASIRPSIPGMDLPGVFLLRWMGDALAFEDFLANRSLRHVVIVGGGNIGLEMAEALTRRGLKVTVIEMAGSVMTTVDPELGLNVGSELARNGVDVLTGQAIASIAADGERLRIEGNDNFSYTADMILVAVGARPETDVARAAGVLPGFKGALKVNRRMETNIPGILAAGDCAETLHRITQSHLRKIYS